MHHLPVGGKDHRQGGAQRFAQELHSRRSISKKILIGTDTATLAGVIIKKGLSLVEEPCRFRLYAHAKPEVSFPQWEAVPFPAGPGPSAVGLTLRRYGSEFYVGASISFAILVHKPYAILKNCSSFFHK
jgi:hypothetical protein